MSGVTMFLLVRALTGRTAAAWIAGALFALYPYHYEHYSHLELEMTMWMPLALLGLHRALARGRVRDGLATGSSFALQTLVDKGVNVVGTADHGVTHSLYITDPDGNEIELYIDVQPERWREDPLAVLSPIKALRL